MFWLWLESNISKEGITHDLEEMKKKGIGGALLYDGGSSSYSVAKRTPAGPPYLGAKWRELFKFALKEAKRLDIEITLNAGGSGWNVGGPWVTPEFAAQKIVFSDTEISGPRAYSNILPLPSGVLKDSLGNIIYYRDVAVLAYRVNKNISFPHKPIRNWAMKTVNTLPREGIVWSSLLENEPAQLGEIDVYSDSLVYLTQFMDANGVLTWNFPAGKWTVLRFGYTITGKKQSTPSPAGEGLMIDPLNPKAMDMHFKTVPEKLIKDAGDLAGNTLKYFFIDSWEEGAVNWTADFPAEFKKRRGYDIMPYLPILAGKIVDSRPTTNRFLYDFRRTIADCIADYYYGRFQQLSHSFGILCNPEAGGPHPAPLDALQCLGRTDVPMGEFWARANTHRVEDWRRIFVKQSASAAHIYGKNLVAMEAFTTLGPHWEKDPWQLKPTADRAFCEGANQFFMVSFTHSPAKVGKPGYEFFAGTHFNPNITWWEQAGAWTEYIARSQLMLQQGLFVGDVCYYYGDNVPNFVPLKHIDPSLGPGYDYDVTNTEVILNRMSVKDGRIVLPDGMAYRMLVLPDRAAITVKVLRKIYELVKAGATVVGPKPVKAPGLTGYPRSDQTVKVLADTLWGPCDGIIVKEHSFGKGRIIWGKPLREVLVQDGIVPDFEFRGSSDSSFLDYIHKVNKDADIYYVANRNEWWDEAECWFRVEGKEPEIWRPDTGDIQKQLLYTVEDSRIKVPLRLEPFGSVFVVFRKNPNRDHVVSLLRNGRDVFASVGEQVGTTPVAELAPGNDGYIELRAWKSGVYTLKKSDGQEIKINIDKIPASQEITGPWQIQFPEGWGAPESVVLDKLKSWTNSSDPGVKYFSGTATYRKIFNVREEIIENTCLALDMGKVKNIAQVRLNGKELGILWKKPFRVNITNAIKPGENELEIEVTNLWPNRLIGDQFLPEEKRYTRTNVQKFTKDSPLLESGLLGPVRIFVAKRERVRL
ncbi:MAG: glycoside hydrolase family 2 [Actinobacteria bacterium]|nr:glycoside hydrolase family 2 [Actinomycetota bacterium]